MVKVIYKPPRDLVENGSKMLWLKLSSASFKQERKHGSKKVRVSIAEDASSEWAGVVMGY